MATTEELDCRHLLCPLPVIRTQAQVARLSVGDELEVVVTDPGALEDIPAWCRVHGHEVVGARETGDEHRIRIRVGGS
ncbi:sulfurtransferase TusA family protein [Halorhodospira halophila]|uniref:SirA family protein n=1 Tax=Halorhodospira halophila (strain DSM 244 / SL1) TaxID=349124 RepID=A1WWD1_HALHL|nr:sulfurtransferase TusA family protein [Halorhodospira halophila]ABM61993.1 SirA family protein [Halorhodospira halophila SL1]MBK1729397.1 SirA family protein [Halorhodospira halophila]